MLTIFFTMFETLRPWPCWVAAARRTAPAAETTSPIGRPGQMRSASCTAMSVGLEMEKPPSTKVSPSRTTGGKYGDAAAVAFTASAAGQSLEPRSPSASHGRG